MKLTLVMMVHEGIVCLHGFEGTRLRTIHRRGRVRGSRDRGPVAHRSYHKGKRVLARDGSRTFNEGRERVVREQVASLHGHVGKWVIEGVINSDDDRRDNVAIG